jgi:predicted DNA-binding transcriptional regulator YafY
MLMQYLQDKPRNMHTISRYLNVSLRTVYRYLKLYEAVGYLIVKDKFNKIQIIQNVRATNTKKNYDQAGARGLLRA